MASCLPDGDPVSFGLDPRCGIGAKVTFDYGTNFGTIMGYSYEDFSDAFVLVEPDDKKGELFWIEIARVKPCPRELGGDLVHGKYGVDRTWFAATTVRPDNLPPDFVIDAIVGVTEEGCDAEDGWDEGIEPRGKIVGYSKAPANGRVPVTDGHVLVDWQRATNDFWWHRVKYLVVGGVTVSDHEPGELGGDYAVGDVLESPNLGRGPIVEIESDEDGLTYWIDFERGGQIEFQAGTPRFDALTFVSRHKPSELGACYDGHYGTWYRATTERPTGFPDGVVLGARVQFETETTRARRFWHRHWLWH